MSDTFSAQRPSKGKTIAALTIQVLLSVAFLAAAGAKLAGVPMMVEIFDQIGFGQWFRIVTALVEILGVVVLWIPGFSVLGALWLGATMFFAFLTHIFILHSNPGGAILLFALNAILAWLRGGEFSALRAKFR